MVGEIRDQETADIAINAALTGHLVFSTLHTNDSAGATTRLLDMGVEPYLVASSLMGVIAQRLVRKICSNCAEEITPTSESLQAIGINPDAVPEGSVFRRGRGCDKCNKSGYRGRVGLYELLTIDETLRRMTVEQSSSNSMRDYAIASQGMRTLLGEGRIAVLAGRTTPEEILRVCQRDEF
jgi:type II secretory ATPase GspE/PulE/Tfp pilus assembly ATPase PilB-like protein